MENKSNYLLTVLNYHISGAIARGEGEAIVGKPMEYVKFRFTHKRYGATAGLVIEAGKYRSTSIPDLSRMFPVSESKKLVRLECSPIFASWDEAFNFDFASMGFVSSHL